MPFRNWTIIPILLCFALAGNAVAAVLNTSARVTVIPCVEISAVDPDVMIDSNHYSQWAVATQEFYEASEHPGLRRLRITGPADLSLHVSLRSMQGELLEVLMDDAMDLHGSDGDMILDIDAAASFQATGQKPLLLYLEYE